MTLEERVRIQRYKSNKKWYRFFKFCGYVGATFAGFLSLWFLLVIVLS
jgi:hypothetical protein